MRQINLAIKRCVDFLGSFIGLIILSPFLLIIALIIKLTSKGPIIFKQERVGLGGKNFMMYKFRTMEVQTKKEEAKGWTTKNDPRYCQMSSGERNDFWLRSTAI